MRINEGKIITLFEEDLLRSCKGKDINDIDLYDFKVELRDIQKAELVRYVDYKSNSIKILKDRYFKSKWVINGKD